MFQQSRDAGVLVITCTRCRQQHRGTDLSARAFKRDHLDQCPRRAA